MRVVVFDTETTGLPKTRETASKGPNNWPHLVSIAWVVIDNDIIVKKKHYIIKPIDWIIPESATKIHGITTEHATQNGSHLSVAISEFMAEHPDVLVAHNMKFDWNVILNAVIWDLQLPYPKYNCKLFCTMEASRNLCKLPSQYSHYKAPKLSELYDFIIKKPLKTECLHNSLYDAEILTEIITRSTLLRPAIGLPVIPQNDTNAYQKTISLTNYETDQSK